MSLVANAAGKLDRLGTRPTSPTESALPRDLSDAAFASDVKQQVATLAQRGLFSGIVMVARGTQIIATATADYADRAKHTPITDSTRFTLGSMGKMFTAASIGQLVDQGKVAFADTVGKFFPDYPNETIRRTVTVGMLLSHTAGLGDFLAKRPTAMMKNGVKRASEFMPLYDANAPLFPPGLAGPTATPASHSPGRSWNRSPARITRTTSANTFSPSPECTRATRTTSRTPARCWSRHTRSSHPRAPRPIGRRPSTTLEAPPAARFPRRAISSDSPPHSATANSLANNVRRNGQATRDTPTGDKYGYAMEITDVYGRTSSAMAAASPVSAHTSTSYWARPTRS